jgi:hypothetical protein
MQVVILSLGRDSDNYCLVYSLRKHEIKNLMR